MIKKIIISLCMVMAVSYQSHARLGAIEMTFLEEMFKVCAEANAVLLVFSEGDSVLIIRMLVRAKEHGANETQLNMLKMVYQAQDTKTQIEMKSHIYDLTKEEIRDIISSANVDDMKERLKKHCHDPIGNVISRQ